MIYWLGNIVLLLSYTVFLSVSQLGKEQKNSLLLKIMFLQSLFLIVFKDNTIFNDIWVYLLGFDYSLTVGWSEVAKIQHFATEVKFELGWAYFTKLVSSLIGYRGVLLLVVGLIILRSHFVFIKKYSQITWFSIFLFITIFFYNSLFVLRQNLALAILLFSIPYIIERKFVKFLIFIVIAFLFHQTALVFVLLYFIYPIKLNVKNSLFFIVFAILFYFVFKNIIETAASLLKGYETYKYGVGDSTIGNITPLLISLFLLLFIVVVYSPISKITKHEKLFFFMILFMVLIDVARIGLTGTIGRLNLYNYPAILILLPNGCQKITNLPVRYLSIGIISVLYFIMMIRAMEYGFALSF